MNATKLRRSESFLGIHFDFHARETDNGIGQHTTREMIQAIIDKTGVDYIQIDCKGHPGYTSYATRLGNAAPGIVTDALPLWRAVTEANNVGLYMHYSGVWDTRAVSEHPEWARVDENGQPDPRNTSLFGAYKDALLIPQLKELCDEYRVDGVWLDGECWAVCQDYAPAVLERFRRETGIQTVPRTLEEPGFAAFMAWNREAFLAYLRDYTDALHRHNPDFQLCSNWAFTSFMPEPVSVGVDFLSGDYPLSDSIRAAQFEGRCLQNQGLAWDLMAWGFGGRFDDAVFSTKTALQLQQEAAIILSLGGGFQVYFLQNRDGSIRPYVLDVMAEVAAFCRARQPFSHKARPIPQIALLYSSYNFYQQNDRMYSGWSHKFANVGNLLDCLVSGQKCVEVIMEHHELEKYPCIVVPELSALDDAYVERLKRYAQNGGRLLVIGETAALFRDELGVTLNEMLDSRQQPQFLQYKQYACGLESKYYRVTVHEDAQTFGTLMEGDDCTLPGTAAASIRSYGRGQIGAVYYNAGENYGRGHCHLLRDLLSVVVDAIFPTQDVAVSGTHGIGTTWMELDGTRMLHLINLHGDHKNDKVYVFDEIPPTGSFTVRIRETKPIHAITLQPEGTPLAFDREDGAVVVRLANVAVHNILQIEG